MLSSNPTVTIKPRIPGAKCHRGLFAVHGPPAISDLIAAMRVGAMANDGRRDVYYGADWLFSSDGALFGGLKSVELWERAAASFGREQRRLADTEQWHVESRNGADALDRATIIAQHYAAATRANVDVHFGLGDGLQIAETLAQMLKVTYKDARGILPSMMGV